MSDVPVIHNPDLFDVIARINAAAFETGKECEHCGGTGEVPGGRRVIHSFLGAFGADWDAAGVIDLVTSSTEVVWGPGLAGHDLAVRNENGKWVRFEVPHPNRPTPE